MKILILPNELLILIGEKLAVKDLSHFLSTCRRLSFLLTPHFHKLALRDVGRCPALLWAVIYGHAPLAELVVSKGADAGKLPWYYRGHTPLHVAAELDYPDVIRVLVKHGAQIDAPHRFNLATPLHTAVANKSSLSVRALLELGADATCRDKDGYSPACCAARNGYIDCLRPFLDAGLDFNRRGTRGETILHNAVSILDSVTRGGEGAAMAMVDYLLDNGALGIINEKNFRGETPLRAAVRVLSKKLIKLLLRYGADPDVKDRKGRPCRQLIPWLDRGDSVDCGEPGS